MFTGSSLSGARRGLLTLATCATAVVAALLLTTQAGGAPAPTPVVMTDVCVNPARGQLSFPLGGSCPAGFDTVAVDDPSATFETCYLNSNGAIRKLPVGGQCVNAPRSKKETLLVVPSLTSDLYLCASTTDGALFFRGTSPVTCKSGQFLVVIEQANNVPVAAAGTLTTLEDTVGATTLSATDEDGDALTFAIATQGTKGTAALTGSVSCNSLTPSTCTRGASYTPQPDVNGSDSFTFTASDAFATSAPATVAVTITPVNDAPSFTKGTDDTVLEDSGARTVNGWATSISAGPANESSQTVSFTAVNDNNSLFSVQPAIAPNGTLTYTPAANAFGSATVTIQAQDNGGTANGGVDTSAPQQFTITVNAVNDEPTFVGGGDVTVFEDSASYAATWATAISAGPPNEAGQTVSFQVSNDNPSLFSAQPAVSPSGTLTFSPAPDAFGAANVTVVAQDNGSTANGGDDTSAAQQFTITVTAVNDAPSFNIPGGDPAPVNEDATAQVVSGFATSISAGPNESGQVLTFVTVDISNPTLFNGIAGLPTIDPVTGDLTYAPAPNANGAAIVEVRLQDDGGTANGGVDTSASRFFTITVNAVNDAPTFTHGGNQTVNEDAGAQSFAGFASGSAGPPDEAGQTLSYGVSNNNNALFSVQPAIAPNGTLTFTPAANAYGSATVDVFLSDNGGTANGGVDTSPTQQFTITVTAVNDEPSFTLPASPNQTVAQDAPAQTVAGFATNISPGPNEGGQTLTFNVSNNNNALFSAQPDINETSGDLTYTPAGGASGTAIVSVFLSDDGGTANGGDDTSPVQQFTITVQLPNQPPVANNDGYSVGEDGTLNANGVSGNPAGVLANDTDADSDPLTAALVDGVDNGTMALNPDGTFTYSPDANFNGVDAFTYKANDGTQDSNIATVTITVTAVNDAPVLANAEAAALSYTENDAATAVTATITVADVDSANLSGATVQITGNYANGQDVLGFVDTASISGSFNAATGALTLTGSDTIADYQTALRSVTYANTSDNPSTSTRTVSFQVDDGGAVNSLSNVATRDISVTAVNDAPVNTAPSAATVDEDTALNFTGGNAISIADADAGSNPVKLSLDVTNGTLTLSTTAGLTFVDGTANGTASVHVTGTLADVNAALAPLRFDPALNFFGTAAFSMVTNDQGSTGSGGALSDTDSFNITVNAVNDAPVADDETFDGANGAIGNTTLVVNDPDDGAPSVSGVKKTITGDILAGDTDVDGPGPLTITAGTFATNDGGSVTIEADGDFTFHPAASTSCTDTSDFFDYTLEDSGSPEATDTGRVTIAIAGCVWYVNNNAAGNSGTSAAPFDTINQAETASGNNHTVFVFDGDNSAYVSDGYTMNTGERLIGEHSGLSVDPDAGGPLPTVALLPFNDGAYPTLTASNVDVVAMASAAVIDGFVIDASGTGGGVSAGAAMGDVTIRNLRVFDGGTPGTQPGIELDSGGGINLVHAVFVTTNGATGIRVNNAGTVIFSPTGETSITTVGAKALDVNGTALGASAFGEIQVTGSGSGGVSMTDTTGTTTFRHILALTTTSGATPAFRLSNAGTVNVLAAANANVSATGGAAVEFFNVAGSINLDATSSTGSSAAGIVLTNVTASFNGGTGSITNAASADVTISGGNGSFDYDGSISDDQGMLVSVASTTGGSKSFDGAISDGNDGDGAGIVLTNNTGATINFTGGLTVSTGASPAFWATGGGTVNVTGSANTIAATTATALNVVNTTIGASDLTFQSISATGATNGIVLNNTGSSGGLTVTGTGPAGSGGAIQNVGTGISLTSTRDVILSDMQLTDAQDFAIRGSSVVNFTLMDTTINGVNGTDAAADEGSVRFTGLTGSASISNSSISGAVENNLAVINSSGTLDRLTISSTTFGAVSALTGDDGLQLEASGPAVFKATVQNSTFNGARGDHLNASVATGATGSMDVVLNNNQFSTTNPAILVPGGGGVLVGGAGGSLTYNISGNTLRDASGTALTVSCGNAGSSCSGRVENNTIGVAVTANSGSAFGSGIALISAGGGTFTSLVNGNTVRQYNNHGILLQAGDMMGNPTSVNLTVTGNTVGTPGTTTPGSNFNGIHLNNGTVGTDSFLSCVHLASNSIAASGTGATSPNNNDLRLRQRQATTVRLPGYAGLNNDNTAVQAFLTLQNTLLTVNAANSVPTGGGYVGGAACTQP